MTWNNGTLILVAIIAFLGQTAAVIVAAWLTQRNARKAQEAAVEAQIATHAAAEDAAKAQKAAADAARDLVTAARATDTRLAEIKTITTGTHTIVNSQRTLLLRTLASLASRVAADNPDDEQAQAVAESTRRVADEAEAAAKT